MDNQLKVTLHVRVISPKGVIFAGDATSVSSTNTVGRFDILPMHANFITIVQNQPTTIRKVGQAEESFTFPLAIIVTKDNQVNIYTDIAQLPKIT